AYRLKQAGQLASKMRFISAPWLGLLDGDVWLRLEGFAASVAYRAEALTPLQYGRVEISSARAVGSSVVGALLGSPVIGEARFAEVDGKKGLAMEKAAGRPMRRQVEIDFTGREEIKAFAEENHLRAARGVIFLPDATVDYQDPVVQEGMLELQLNDLLTGQVDRHAGNYHIDVDEEGTVRGINAFDNDGAFGTEGGFERYQTATTSFGGRAFNHTVSLPPLLLRDQAERLMAVAEADLREQLSPLLPAPEVEAAIARLRLLKAHVKQLRADGQIFDALDEQTHQQLRHAGAESSYLARDAAAQERLQQLQQMLEASGWEEPAEDDAEEP
ncbi:MAG: hypothetical protein AAFV53_39285, partial [Myxococcota bacterium]